MPLDKSHSVTEESSDATASRVPDESKVTPSMMPVCSWKEVRNTGRAGSRTSQMCSPPFSSPATTSDRESETSTAPSRRTPAGAAVRLSRVGLSGSAVSQRRMPSVLAATSTAPPKTP